MAEKEMPYERFLEHGAECLTNAELLAIILRTGTQGVPAVELGRRVLQMRREGADALSVLRHVTIRDLEEVPGIGQVKAVKLLALAEIARRMGQERVSARLNFLDARSVADYYMEELRHRPQETALVLELDQKLGLIAQVQVSLGTVNATFMSTRDIFIHALQDGAVNIILLHNHPSGDPTPSEEDLLVTQKVRRAGELLEIHLLDHLIIGDLRYTSLKEEGYL